MTTKALILLSVATFIVVVILTLAVWWFSLVRDEKSVQYGQNTIAPRESVEKAAPSAEARNPCSKPPCKTRGTQKGDFDGDGNADQAELFLVFKSEIPIVRIDIRFENGQQHIQDFGQHLEPAPPQWLGVSDINGDGRDDLFWSTFAGAQGRVIRHLEYQHKQLRPLRGLEATWSLYSNGSGITCRQASEKHQLVSVELLESRDGPRALTREAQEIIYEADQAGQFHQVSVRKRTFTRSSRDAPWSEEADNYLKTYGGIHCPGLASATGTSPPPVSSYPTACDKEQFIEFMISRDKATPADLVVQVLSCKGDYAYVRFEGDIGVHGTQSVLFQKAEEKYIDIIWGETSHGAIGNIDPELGINLCKLAEDFPEMGTFFLEVNEVTCPSEPPP